MVSNDNRILEANPATCAAAKKRRDQVIGQKVCDILHGGHAGENKCPLEQFISYQKTQITETELHGLHGKYMLTVSPLLEENGEINATLLLARNLTEEEVVRAEAIRAAQLAAIGELASGIAHEINNPINGIINYAQIILDEPDDPETNENLGNIISEGKRIAGIVSNLLDFARRREEILAPARIEKMISNSLQLVAHLLKTDGIICSVNIDDSLPPLMCNEQQLQQVVLNMISNARYALNKRYPKPCPEKKLEIKGELINQHGITINQTDIYRQWHWDCAGNPGETVRPVFLHQTKGRRNRPGLKHQSRFGTETMAGTSECKAIWENGRNSSLICQLNFQERHHEKTVRYRNS